MLNLGWVDFSKSDRDMVMSVLRQLTKPGAVDEIGIGTIRDGFADILFPGTSTIQTRAKYLFIIPYICLELERGKKLSPREFLHVLEQNELGLIDVLAVDGADGVIGQRSRHTLRRKPSSIYWNALRVFGFLTEPVSLSEYSVLQYARRETSDNLRKSGNRKARNEDDTIDDADTGMKGSSLWRVPIPDEKWRGNLTINLTKTEANHLREKILSMPGSRDSLLALVLREKWFDFVEYKTFDDIDGMQNVMPGNMWNDYRLARDFSRFIYGAQVRYNIIFSEGMNENANKEWEKYIDEKPDIDLSEIHARLKPRPDVMSFLKKYKAVIDNEKELDNLIIQREKKIKSPSRAKLTNRELYKYNGNSVNMVPLSYRLSNVQDIVRDIFEVVRNDA